MTSKQGSKTASTGGGKGKKLSLSRQVLKDLRPTEAKLDAIKGAAAPISRTGVGGAGRC